MLYSNNITVNVTIYSNITYILLFRPQNIPAQVEETTGNVPVQEEDPVSSDDDEEKIKDDYSFKEKTLSILCPS